MTTRIFLASSAELKDDRVAFELLINRRNKAWKDQGVFLELVVWEDFLDAMSRTRLQDEYNRAIRECDVFVMLFFTKVGPFTTEEFETAFQQFQATGKPVIFTYFKDAPINTGSANMQDLIGLHAFRTRLAELGHFHTSYQNVEALQLSFTQQLEKLAASGALQRQPAGQGAPAPRGAADLSERAVLIDGNNAGPIVTGTQIVNHYHAASGGRLSRAEIAAQVEGYLRWLRGRTQHIELRGIERAGGAPVVLLPLETAYVPLRARPAPRVGEGEGLLQTRRKSRAHQPAPEEDVAAAKAEADVALSEVLGLGNRLAIIGGPGCGKTTVLLHMAWALASSLLAGEAEPAQSRLGLRAAPGELPLPIFVPLASFARHRRHLPANAPPGEMTLAHFISNHLIAKTADFNLPPDFFVQLLGDGRDVLLLLDGLDEVADEGERAEVRQSVEELVSGRDAMRVLVTCRTVAYRSGRTALGAAFREIAVQALDAESHIAPMVRQAYACIHPDDSTLRDQRSDDLLAGIARLEADRRARLGGDAEALIGSPLMVRLLLIVHFNNRVLPDERADLFDKAVNALLQVDYGREESDIRELTAGWKLFRDMAQHLAFHMHGQGKDQGREIDERALKLALRQVPEFAPHVDEFLSHARQRGSVIEERDGSFRFIHLAFQEFMVARYLNEVVGDAGGQAAILDLLAPRFEAADPWWREPVLLLAGYKAAKTARTAHAFIAALGIAGTTANGQWCAAELAATAALEWHDCATETRLQCAQRIATLLADEASMLVAQPAVRARAGDALARLGDPRLDSARLHLPADDMLGFVRIPADRNFRIGISPADRARVSMHIGAEVYDDEINDQPTPTPDFFIARYPVTVAQFRAFVEATGVQPIDVAALRDDDTRPVRRLSWHEARRYCEWLNGRLADAPELADLPAARLVREHGWRVALPSELEWEKAARGEAIGQAFSWGDVPDPQRANFDAAGVGSTSAVGCFPSNSNGLHDMLGNVWEWTRSLWGKKGGEPDFRYPYSYNDAKREDLEASDEVLRVVRGGAFFYTAGLARCGYRRRLRPVYRLSDLGFRVVLRSAVV